MNYTELLETIKARPDVVGVEDTNRDGQNQFFDIRRIIVYQQRENVISSGTYVIMENKETGEFGWLNRVPEFMIDRPEPVVIEAKEEIIKQDLDIVARDDLKEPLLIDESEVKTETYKSE
jgi:hypothetical protein